MLYLLSIIYIWRFRSRGLCISWLSLIFLNNIIF